MTASPGRMRELGGVIWTTRNQSKSSSVSESDVSLPQRSIQEACQARFAILLLQYRTSPSDRSWHSAVVHPLRHSPLIAPPACLPHAASMATMSSSHIPLPPARPHFVRSRSHTIPSNTSVSPNDPSTKPARPPSSGRSSSFLAPVTTKPREAQTLPVTAAAGGIVSYAQRHAQSKPQSLHHVQRHKYTQSEAHGSRKRDPEALPHLTAGLVAERKRQDPERSKATDFLLGPRAHELRRIGSTRSYRPAEVANADGRTEIRRNELRRRATSDPKPPVRVAKSPIENALDRAYEKKLAKMASITQKDVDRMNEQCAEAEEELRGRLDDLGQMATDMTRRLDYTYYSLLERIGGLVSTIQSFQSLSTQSRALVEGFEREGDYLEADIKRRIETFWEGFDERDVRVADLEQRGKKAGSKAAQLGQRLESARIIVEEWEKRESVATTARARMWVGTWCAFIGLIGFIMMIVVWKEWSSGSDPVRSALGVPTRGNLNKSLMIDEEVLHEKQIPEDVKSILYGIESRRNKRGPTWTLPALVPVQTAEDDDKRLRALDEL